MVRPASDRAQRAARFVRSAHHAGEYEHEREVLTSLGEPTEALDEEHTTELIAARVPVIYQPKVLDKTLGVITQPDFLFSEPAGYRAAGATLARSIENKLDLRIQLAVYLKVLKTDLPTKALLGNGESVLNWLKDLVKAGEFLADIKHLAGTSRPEVHFGSSRCNACPYRERCVPEFQATGDLGQNYFIDVRAIRHLEALGIYTLADLAGLVVEAIPDVPYLKGDKIASAVLQAQAFLELRPVVCTEPPRVEGTPIHFDIETNPLAVESDGEVYLWGFLVPPYEKDDFEYVWHDVGAEADLQGWNRFLEVVAEQGARYPGAVYVRYARFQQYVISLYAKKFEDTGHA